MSRGAKIAIRESTEQDYGCLKAWFEERDNNIFFTSALRDIADYKKIYFLMALKDKKNVYYTITLENSREPVGFVALINIDHGDQFGQLWYVVGDGARRSKGIMTKALHLLLAKARSDLGLHSVFTWVVDDNIASIRVLEKCGFTRMGVQREAYCYKGEYKNRILFDRLL
jgi:RimJ/RimL family protein N-acetyltransferase